MPLNQSNNVNAFTDLGRFTTMRTQIGKSPDGAVAEVAKEFEALFIEMMLSSARKASIKGGAFDSHALDLYRQMFDSQAARVLAGQGALGFEQVISKFVAHQPADGHSVARQDGGIIERDVSEAPKLGALANEQPLTLAKFHPDLMPLIPDQKSVYANPHVNRIAAAETVEQVRALMPSKPSQSDFVATLMPHAKSTAQKLGTEPEILIAQAALETGWGRHMITTGDGRNANNYFGIKANKYWQGEVSEVKTFEFLGGRPIKTKASFKTYSDISASFDDYLRFVRDNPRYERAFGSGSRPELYIQELARAGYATDPKYAEKIIEIRDQIKRMNLPDYSSHAFADDAQQMRVSRSN